MAKKLFAVTGIKGSNAEIAAGDEVPQEQFSKDELKGLYDAGALEVREVDDTQAMEVPTPETGVQTEENVETVEPSQPVE